MHAINYDMKLQQAKPPSKGNYDRVHRILAKMEGDKQITPEEFSKLTAEIVKNENGGRVMTVLGDERAGLNEEEWANHM